MMVADRVWVPAPSRAQHLPDFKNPILISPDPCPNIIPPRSLDTHNTFSNPTNPPLVLLMVRPNSEVGG